MEEIAKSNNPYPVAPTGYLMGSYLALALYGVHISQVVRYYGRHRDSWKIKCLVGWIFTLSTLQILIILLSSWKYFVGGITEPEIWGEFWWPLSFQDGLVPLMAFTAQLYFGRRAWMLTGRRPWMLWLTCSLATVTFACGVALAVTAHVWSKDPYVSPEAFRSRHIGVPSQIVAITWMGLSAFTDGCITLLLVWRFRQAKNSVFYSTRTLVKRMVALTLETVLLTHIVGGVMCIIFLASPAAHRTKSDIFWVLLESVTELYALSVVFTINSRPPAPVSAGTPTTLKSDGTEPKDDREVLPNNLGQTVLDYHVEGYQGSTPFGVRPSAFMRQGGESQPDSMNGRTSTLTRDGTASPFTPMDELGEYGVFSTRPMVLESTEGWARNRTEDIDEEEKGIDNYTKDS